MKKREPRLKERSRKLASAISREDVIRFAGDVVDFFVTHKIGLLDWEEADPKAPYMGDCVFVELDQNNRLRENHVRSLLRNLYKEKEYPAIGSKNLDFLIQRVIASVIAEKNKMVKSGEAVLRDGAIIKKTYI